MRFLAVAICVAMCAQLPSPPSDERKKVVEDVDRDRRYSIDAAIVRTMKSRKVLQHQQVRSLFSLLPTLVAIIPEPACLCIPAYLFWCLHV